MAEATTKSGAKERKPDNMIFRFPGRVEVIDDNTISVEMSVSNRPALSKELVDEVIRRLGDRDGERFLDEMTDRINREFVLRSIL